MDMNCRMHAFIYTLLTHYVNFEYVRVRLFVTVAGHRYSFCAIFMIIYTGKYLRISLVYLILLHHHHHISRQAAAAAQHSIHNKYIHFGSFFIIIFIT